MTYLDTLTQVGHSVDRQMLETLFARSHVGAYVVQRGKFCWVSPQFARETGYAPKDLLGVQCLTMVPPEDRPKVRENAVRMLKGTQTFPYHYRMITRSGEVKWMLETVASVQYQGGQAALGLVTDISALKRAQEVEQRRTQDLGLLFAIAEALAGAGTSADEGTWVGKTTRALELLIVASHTSYAVLRVGSANGNGLSVLTEAGKAPAGWLSLFPQLDLSHLAAAACHTGEVLVRNCKVESRGQLSGSVAAFPMSCSGRTLGVLECFSQDADHFAPERVRLLSAVADMIGPLLEGARLLPETGARGP